MEMIGEVVVLFILFQALVITSGRLCHFETEITASFWIRKPCVFFFGNETKIIKYIGNELRFGEDAGSKGAFRGLKVNLNEFFESPLTLWNKSCDCTEVPCLNEQQLNNLFANSLKLVRKEVPTRFRYLPRLCCSLQQVLGELVFRLLPEDIAKLTRITLKGSNIHNWTTCVSNELRQTEWCKTFKDRCDNLIDRITRGCDEKAREKRDIDLIMTTVCSSSSCFQDEGSVSSSSLMTLQRISLSSMVSFTAMTSSANSLKKSVQVLDTNSSPTCGSQQPSLSSVLFTSSFPGSWSTKSSTAPAESRAFLRELSLSPSLSSYVTPLMAKDQEGGVVTTTFGYKAKTPPFWNSSFSLTSSTVGVSEGSPLVSLSASQNTFFNISTDVTSVVDTDSYSFKATSRLPLMDSFKPTSLKYSRRQAAESSSHSLTASKSTESFTSFLSSSSSSSLVSLSSFGSLSLPLPSLSLTSPSIQPSALLSSLSPLLLLSSSLSSPTLITTLPSSLPTSVPAQLQISRMSLSSSTLTFYNSKEPKFLPSSSNSRKDTSSSTWLLIPVVKTYASSSSVLLLSLSSSTIVSPSPSTSSLSSSSSSSSSSHSSSTPTTTIAEINPGAETTLSPSLSSKLSSYFLHSLPPVTSLRVKLRTTETTISSSSPSSTFTLVDSQLPPYRFSAPLLTARTFSSQKLTCNSIISSCLSTYVSFFPTTTPWSQTSLTSAPSLVFPSASLFNNSSLILKISLAAESHSSLQDKASYVSFSRTDRIDLKPSSAVPTFQFSSLKLNTVKPLFTETFVVKFKGDCSVIVDKNSFKLSFVATLASILRIPRDDVIVDDVICGSVSVVFTVKTARERNLTSELLGIIKNESLVVKYNDKVFIAFDVKIISNPTVPTKFSRPTEISNHDRQKLLFIIFIFFCAVFAALFVFFSVVFCSRFCACCQKTGKFRMHKRVRLRAQDFELKRFAERRSRLSGANYYGEDAHKRVNSRKKELEVEIEEEDINDYYEDEFVAGPQADANDTLLNSTNHTANSNQQEEQKFVFDDEDSCSSVLFY